VRVCSLRYPACNAHAPHCQLCHVQINHIFQHYLTNSTIFEKKDLLNIKRCVLVSVQFFLKYISLYLIISHYNSYLIISHFISLYLIISQHISLYLIITHISLYLIIFHYISLYHNISHYISKERTTPHFRNTPSTTNHGGKKSWTPQEKTTTRRCQNRSRDRMHGGR